MQAPSYAYVSGMEDAKKELEIRMLYYRHSYGVEELADIFNTSKQRILSVIGGTQTLASMGV